MRRGVRDRKLKYIKVVTKPNGKKFTYYSEPHKKRARLPDLPHNHPEFLKAYLKATDNAESVVYGTMPKTGTIAAMIVAYKKSDHFMSLKKSTQYNRNTILELISIKRGSAKAIDLRAQHIKSDIAGLAPHPANNRLKTWRGLCKWAESANLITSNPALNVQKKKTPKTEGHTPWSLTDIEIFRNYWHIETPQRLAMELLYWTGSRCGDAVRLSQGMVDNDGWLNYTQEKTGGKVSIPWTRALPDWATNMDKDRLFLHSALDAKSGKHLTLVTTKRGKSQTAYGLSQWFSYATKKAFKDLGYTRSAHGLRKSRAIAIAEAGGTTHQIGAWTGHETLSEIQHYSQSADKKKLLSGVEQEHILETAVNQFPK